MDPTFDIQLFLAPDLRVQPQPVLQAQQQSPQVKPVGASLEQRCQQHLRDTEETCQHFYKEINKARAAQSKDELLHLTIDFNSWWRENQFASLLLQQETEAAAALAKVQLPTVTDARALSTSSTYKGPTLRPRHLLVASQKLNL